MAAGIQAAQAQAVKIWQNGKLKAHDASAVDSITFDQKNFINGHEFVDLGLPSGTLWATCNIGAKSPEKMAITMPGERH